MANRTRTIVAGIGVVAALYVVALPLLRPKPRVFADVPATVHMRDVVPIDITVTAWHRSVDIANARFYVDYTNSTATGPKGIFNPVILYDQAPRKFGRVALTWPYERHERVELALAPFADDGLLGPGTLTGKIDVTLSYVPGRQGKSFERDRSRREMMSVPFSITVTE